MPRQSRPLGQLGNEAKTESFISENLHQMICGLAAWSPEVKCCKSEDAVPPNPLLGLMFEGFFFLATHRI